ncbi:MAG: DNA-3-methyladenine glycosylase I [Alphaproteobacteria bacterium]
MQAFDRIFDQAAALKGGAAALEALLPETGTAAALKALPDDRYLAEMTKCVFQAGFAWKVIEAKWAGFENAFLGFAPGRITALSDEDLDAFLQNRAIVRNGQKIKATRDNAAFVNSLAAEHGSAGAFFAGWPQGDFTGLWAVLKARGARLGGMSGQMFLRRVGVDTPILSRDVLAALVREGVVDKAATSKRDLAKTQAAFDAWRGQSRRPLAQISRILAASVGPGD